MIKLLLCFCGILFIVFIYLTNKGLKSTDNIINSFKEINKKQKQINENLKRLKE